MHDILRSISLIEDYLEKAGGLDLLLRTENELHDAVERRLMIISEAAVNLGELAERLEPDIPWRSVLGLGNSLRHNYDGVSDDVMRAVLTTELAALAGPAPG